MEEKGNIIIQLSGFKGSGKDTVGKYLQSKLPACKLYAYADVLKEQFCKKFDFDLEKLEEYKRDENLEFEQIKDYYPNIKKASIRFGLIEYSNELKKEHGENYFIDIVTKKIESFPMSFGYHIITDMRCKNEMEAFKDSYSIRINRDSCGSNIPMENNLNNEKFDYYIDNNTTLEDLYLKCDNLYEKLNKLSPFCIYISSDQLQIIRNLCEVDSKIFNLMTWNFTKDKMICTAMNDIESVISCNVLEKFDEYVINDGPYEVTIEPKEFWKQILKEKKRKDIIEIFMVKNQLDIIHVNIHDSSITNMIYSYQYYQSNKKPKCATFPSFECNLSFLINSSLFHNSVNGLKMIKKEFELVIKNNIVLLKCVDDFKVNGCVKIGESNKSLLFSQKNMDDVNCSFGRFKIDTIKNFQKLITYSHLMEIRLMKSDHTFPIILIYQLGNIGTKSLIIKPN